MTAISNKRIDFNIVMMKEVVERSGRNHKVWLSKLGQRTFWERNLFLRNG